MAEIIEALPVVVDGKRPAEMTVPELLGENARLGALRLHELLSVPVRHTKRGKLYEPASMRIVREAASSSLTLYVRVAEGELKARQGGELIEFLERLNALREKGSGP